MSNATKPALMGDYPAAQAGQSAIWKYKGIYNQGDDRAANGAMSSTSRMRGKSSCQF